MDNFNNTEYTQTSLFGLSPNFVEDLYEQYLEDPSSVPKDWQQLFNNLLDGQKDINHAPIRQYFLELAAKPRTQLVASRNQDTQAPNNLQPVILELITEYRLHGHMHADLDPLGIKEKKRVAELEIENYKFSPDDMEKSFPCGNFAGSPTRPLKQLIADLRRVYCGTTAAEFMHITDTEERRWVQSYYENMFFEDSLSKEEKLHILEGLIAADGLERYLAAKYPGAKRFGLEGCDSLIVAIDSIIQHAGKLGTQEVLIGMAHRGRLNVLVNILGKNPADLFDEFEGKHYSKEIESGDVKYHQGFSSDIETEGGYMHLSMAFNPSHLEVVSPVVCGSVRARQDRRNNLQLDDVFAINIHGDSAFAGQGIVMETLNMSQTRYYSTGGSIHIITNNQVGFTTSRVDDVRSTHYCSDVSKMLQVPIFHLNANDPEGVYKVAKLATAYRNKYHKDVIIDLIGFRRNGHNEADEPSVTQPLMYKAVKKMQPACKLYAEELAAKGIIDKATAKTEETKYREALNARDKAVARRLVSGWENKFASDWSPYQQVDWRHGPDTGIEATELVTLANKRDSVPDNFILHSRVAKIVNDRRKMTQGELPIDWGYAETLALASLIQDGHPVRLSGQDSGRGTFFHRHAVWHCQESGVAYSSLANLAPAQAKFTVIDSVLSEAAVLGFEYGFSTSEPRALVIWEAQFGDFANSAQVVIDQFITSGQSKWGRLSGLTMFLPHGYEGQGPEHSSARIERYLQLCACQNIQICIPSTPAQVFHMLRRQVLRNMRKPLIVMTPKSLLRHKRAVSSIQELTSGKFLPLIEDDLPQSAIHKVILASGKIYYELLAYRESNAIHDVALVRIEQIYPFPQQELRTVLQNYSQAKEVVWCQEEPKNQGAWFAVSNYISCCLAQKQKLSYAGREASASPAVGYAHLHKEQQEQVIKDAFA